MRYIGYGICLFLLPLGWLNAEEVKIISVTQHEFSTPDKTLLAAQELITDTVAEEKQPGEKTGAEKDSATAAGTEGWASWYGGKFQGRKTASGEIFDTRQFTAAHKTLSFGTRVKVVNLDNGKATVVRVNDRGPFVEGRIIDLSQAAAVQLDMMKTGVARVRVEVLEEPAHGTRALYRIQVASFKNRENALRIKTILSGKGYAVYFERTAEGMIRVHVDNVAQQDLESVTRELKGLGLRSHLVRKIN